MWAAARGLVRAHGQEGRVSTQAQAETERGSSEPPSRPSRRSSEEKRVLEFTREQEELKRESVLAEAKRPWTASGPGRRQGGPGPQGPRHQALGLRAGTRQVRRHRGRDPQVHSSVAPQDGMVVYYVSGAEPVRLRQPAVDHRPGRAGPRGPEADAHPRPDADARQHPRPRGDGLARPGEKWQTTGFSERRAGRPAVRTRTRWSRLFGRPASRRSARSSRPAPRAIEMRRSPTASRPRSASTPSRERLLEGDVKIVATVASQQDWMSCRREGLPDDGVDRRVDRGPEARHERRGDDLHRRARRATC